jgi:SHS2 domain-containing protein
LRDKEPALDSPLHTMAGLPFIPIEWPILEQRDCYKAQTLRGVPLGTVAASISAAEENLTSRRPSGARPLAAAGGGWEYLDHTADVQIHAWGLTMGEAFAAAAQGMFGYMVELAEIKDDMQRTVVASGHDWESMLFAFLDECLYIFHTEALAMTRIVVDRIDVDAWTVTASASGGLFDSSKHKQGTEVKAITYSNMQILHPEAASSTSSPPDRRAQIYVIVDI